MDDDKPNVLESFDQSQRLNLSLYIGGYGTGGGPRESLRDLRRKLTTAIAEIDRLLEAYAEPNN